jgi:hypothetical protein
LIALEDRRTDALIAPVIAAALALGAVLVGWRGLDLPAQIYRVGLFHRNGLTLWDSQWYGGHWTFSYSVIFPPLAGLIGVQVTEVASAAVAALAFDRLVHGHFGRAARFGSLIFAVGTLAQVAIGQLPFLLGEALALGACWAATGRRWRLGAALAVATSLASPLAGAFLLLAMVAWLLTSWPSLRVELGCMAAGASLPIIAVGLLFPGQGFMPFPAIDFIWLVVLFVAVSICVPRRERALRVGVYLYLVAAVLSFFLPTPMGGNISRLADCLGGPLAACALWSHRRRALAVIVLPLVLMQWVPAIGSLLTERRDPSTHLTYFSPLLAYLGQHADPAGRVEIVPTRLHWEAAYAAPAVPLARGWDRQLDTAVNPLFYADRAPTAASYRAWLLDSGVRYVALPDVQLDFAAVDEAHLINSGVAGLRPVWRNSHWRVFEVVGSSGIVDGPGRLVRLDGGDVMLDAIGPGTILVRVRFNPRWTLSQGQGCVRQASGGWTAIDTSQPGQLHLELRLVHPPDACAT